MVAVPPCFPISSTTPILWKLILSMRRALPDSPPPRHTSPRLYLLAQMVPHPFLHGSLLRGMVMGGLERKEWPPPGLGGDRGALGRLAA